MKISRAGKLKIIALFALPALLYAVIVERQTWQPRTLPVFPKPSGVWALLWTNSGKSLVVRNEGVVRVWDVEKKSLTYSINIKEVGSSIAFSSTGVLACEVPGRDLEPCYESLDLWDVQKKKRLTPPNVRWPFVFSADGRQLTGVWERDYSRGYSIQIKSLDVHSARVQKTVEVAIPKGSYLRHDVGPAGGGGTCGSSEVADVALSPDGERGAVSLLRDGKAVWSGVWWKPSVQGDVMIFDARSGHRFCLLPASRLPVSLLPGSMQISMNFSPDGRTLIITGSAVCQLWDAQTGRLKSSIKEQPGFTYGSSAEMSPDNTLLACAEDQGEVSLWEVPSGRLRRRLQTHSQGVSCLAFSPDGSTLAIGNDSVQLWRIR